MSEYKRFTKKDKYDHWYTDTKINDRFMWSINGKIWERDLTNCAFDGEAIDRLAELEDKIERGQLVEIPKGSVVLSKEEQEKILTATESRINKLKEQVKQAQKETAEKIFEILYQWLDLENIEKLGFVTIQKFDFLQKFREIYKQFDVGIKE